MLKEEFDKMIAEKRGIEYFDSDDNVFEMFNKMYMAIDCDKQMFVNIINVDSVKEAEKAVNARIEALAKKEEIKQEIELLKKDITSKKAELKDDFTYQYRIALIKREIKENKTRINELKFIYNL